VAKLLKNVQNAVISVPFKENYRGSKANPKIEHFIRSATDAFTLCSFKPMHRDSSSSPQRDGKPLFCASPHQTQNSSELKTWEATRKVEQAPEHGSQFYHLNTSMAIRLYLSYAPPCYFSCKQNWENTSDFACRQSFLNFKVFD